ncbi:ATP-binding cassette domain-containing protein [Paenibacillus sp. LHD-117]|uniref:ABC transporter ATP-binding protein n=1 Tax=Paenibacillus sp. LHD-117 TaxID=3071412 RepID=UPI0027E0F449|nr:ATP-binding cassette domain-containing protein [Paenibacillus sp. LHD-117]MDQ6419067.1 ATP-binding cassette domain-containing protein [Paenibacillus sp. LHD-117]
MESGKWQGKNLGWRYGKGAWLFRHYSIEVSPGEIVGLMGPSGTGKSTLGKLLAGYMTPTEGEVTASGVHLRGDGYRPVQLIHQHPELAVNPRWTLGKTIAEGWQPDAGLLVAFGIEEAWLRRYPNELSGGQLQRCCIVRSLGAGTKFIVADEMSAMLDAITQAEIWHALLTVAKSRDIGIIAISHDKPLLDAICDRIVRLESVSHSER